MLFVEVNISVSVDSLKNKLQFRITHIFLSEGDCSSEGNFAVGDPLQRFDIISEERIRNRVVFLQIEMQS